MKSEVREVLKSLYHYMSGLLAIMDLNTRMETVKYISKIEKILSEDEDDNT